jgi:hypothetical protein
MRTNTSTSSYTIHYTKTCPLYGLAVVWQIIRSVPESEKLIVSYDINKNINVAYLGVLLVG